MLPSDRQEPLARTILIARAVVGLGAGLLFYALDQADPKVPALGVSEEHWIVFLQMARNFTLIAPLPVLFGLGRLPAKRLAVWASLSAVALIIVGLYAPPPTWNGFPKIVVLWLFSLIVIFIVHEFVQASFEDKQKIASYTTYFDNSWRHGLQAVLALIFVGAFWVVIAVGAFLFNLIGLEFVEDAVFSPWFAFPASTVSFSLAIHWTDEGSTLTRGARQIGLAMLSWLSILMTFFLSAFLIALVFTGLTPLWETNNATALLLNAVALIILLINAAYQAGEIPASPLVRLVVRFSPAPLIGITILAAIGVMLRVDQYGFTPARVLATAELIIVALYAIGYGVASVRPGPWMAIVKRVNIAVAAMVAIVLFLLMTPIADPARVSVASQVARLDKGIVEPDDFDFGFLADDRAGVWGERALDALAARGGDPRNDRIALLAQNPGRQDSYYRVEQSMNDRREAILPVGAAALPDRALLPQDGYDPIAECVRMRGPALAREARADTAKEQAGKPADEENALPLSQRRGPCVARMVDLNADGQQDILLFMDKSGGDPVSVGNLNVAAILQTAPDEWQTSGGLQLWGMNGSIVREPGAQEPAGGENKSGADIGELSALLLRAKVTPSRFSDLIIRGERVRLVPVDLGPRKEELANAVSSIDGKLAPDIVFAYQPLAPLALGCAKRSGPPHCFGWYDNVDNDPEAEYITLSLSYGAQSGGIQVYDERDGTLQLAGSGEIGGRYRRTRPAQDQEGVLKPLEPVEVANNVTIAPALLDDILVSGHRITFRYDEDFVRSQKEKM
ncbi:MAG: DUF4153 domain-containing protein [Pseudomonadota bacterium]